MRSAESIGQTLNTNPLVPPRDVSSCEQRVCRCGNIIEPMCTGNFRHLPSRCTKCQKALDKELKRRERKEKARILRARLRRFLPKLFQDAHLRKVSPKLKKIMLQLPEHKGLLLYGPAGVGKSYAMCALMRHYSLKGHTIERAIYDALCLNIRDTYNSDKSEKELIERCLQPDKLLIEDVGTTVGTIGQESDFSLRTFLLILDYRLEHGKATFITTNKTIGQLAGSFDQRVASRLQQVCEIIPVSGRDKRSTACS